MIRKFTTIEVVKSWLLNLIGDIEQSKPVCKQSRCNTGQAQSAEFAQERYCRPALA